jgi:uncharacterized protein
MNGVVKLTTAAVILALGMVFSSALLSRFFVRIRHEQAISVKGYAEKDVVSDVGKFACVCSARGASLADAYEKLQTGRSAVMEYLKQRGFAAAEITPETIRTSKISRRDAQGKDTNEIEYYDVLQEVSVASTNVALIKDAAIRITELIKEGIDVGASSPEFYVSDLKNAKLDLLAKATEDGRRRAAALAENSVGKVGALMSAQQGVFQITQRHSTDTSGYGMYDNSTIEKTAKAVVTLEYAVEAKK